MPTKTNKSSETSPAKFIPQLIGGVAGAFGNWAQQKKAANAAGEKLTLKNMNVGNLLKAGAGGAVNPVAGIAGGIGGAVTSIANAGDFQDSQEVEANNEQIPGVSQTYDPNDPYAAQLKDNQNSSINKTPVFSPSSASKMRSLFKTI